MDVLFLFLFHSLYGQAARAFFVSLHYQAQLTLWHSGGGKLQANSCCQIPS